MTGLYDLVFGIGAACPCTECLRDAGLQYASFPFDWLIGSTLERRVRFITEGHGDWLPKDSLEHVFTAVAVRTDAYRDNRTGIIFNHDFPAGVPLEESYPKVLAKYNRRFDRLLGLLNSARRVLVVYLGAPTGYAPTDEEMRDARALLQRRFPGKDLDLLVFRMTDNAEPRTQSPFEGVQVVAFNYQVWSDLAGANLVDKDKIIGWLRESRIRCRDYRTADERRRWLEEKRRKEWRKYGASGFWDCQIVKLQYRLYRHLLKRMKKKGLA